MPKYLLIFLFCICSIIANAAVEWNGNGDGVSWSDGDNWAGGNVPGNGEDASILDGSSVVIDTDLGVSIKKLKIKGGSTLSVNTGAVLVTTDHIEADGGNFYVTGGSVDTGTKELKAKNGGVVNLTGGTITTAKLKAEGTGSLTVNGSSVTAGKIEAKGTATMNLTSGSLTVSGEIKAKDTGTLNINMTVTGTNPSKDFKLEDGANVTIGDGGNVSGFRDIKFDGDNDVATLEVTTGGSLSVLENLNADASSNDIINISGGSISIAGTAEINDSNLTVNVTSGSISVDTITDTNNGSGDPSDNFNVSGSGQVIEGGVVVLDVELIMFKAELIDDGVIIKWETASELNNDRFEVQKSSDAVSFSTIASIAGGGTYSGILKYHYVDKKISTGMFYYRLVQYDFDGKFEIFPIISLLNDREAGLNQIIVYPNPVDNNHFNLKLSGRITLTNWTVTIMDLTGKTLYVENQAAGESQFSYSNFREKISSGSYLIHIRSATDSISRLIQVK